MDDMNVFERLVGDEMVRRAGPEPFVDDAAIFSAISATQSPKWRFQPMFSATKFVVAGAIVALFGGFLMAGVIMQEGDEQVPGAAATPSVSPAATANEAATRGPGTFSPAGSLAEPRREGHTATLLPDGRVLVIGGSGEDFALASAEVWDPATSTFGPAGALAEGRWDHTATLLPDGRVLVVGGWDPITAWRDQGADPGPLTLAARASAEIWDPVTASFGPAGTLAEPRFYHTATLLPDGRVLIFGGTTVEMVSGAGTAEIWDPATASFGPAGTLDQVYGYGYTTTLLADGRVLIVYGENAEIWDPETASISPVGPLANGRQGHTATLLPDGRVLVVGGGPKPAEVWDPADASFSHAGTLAEPRVDHTATLLPDGRVLVVGGSDVSNTSVEIWDPDTASFSPAASLIQARDGHTATLLADGRVLIVGGQRRKTEAEVWGQTNNGTGR